MKKTNRTESIVNFLNWVSDQEAGWFPFPHLRPVQNQKIGFEQLSRIAFYFGLSYGLLCAFAQVMINGEFNAAAFSLIAISFVPLCFICYGALVAIPWNIRVREKAQLDTPWYDRKNRS